MAVPRDFHEAKNELGRRLLGKSIRSLEQIREVSTTRSVTVLERIQTSTIHAVGVGRKIVDGQETSRLAIRLYVARKLPLNMLRSYADANKIEG